jgi:hypothetical protein
MNARRRNETHESAPPEAVARCREAIFRALNRRAHDLALNDDVAPALRLAASTSAMIADSLTRLTPIEPGAKAPAEAPFLRLVRGDDQD